jgi:hypothetical protein
MTTDHTSSHPGDLRLFVWRGAAVLRNYAAGMVVVAAGSAGDAFAKLRASAPSVWLRLSHGSAGSWCETEHDVQWVMAQDDFETEEGFPLQPEVFGLADLPVLYVNGGE